MASRRTGGATTLRPGSSTQPRPAGTRRRRQGATRCQSRPPPWPGVPARGRGAATRSDASWVPIAPGLTPHGLRHTYRSLMEELGTPKKLMDAQMGHEDGSIGARYAHVTARWSIG